MQRYVKKSLKKPGKKFGSTENKIIFALSFTIKYLFMTTTKQKTVQHTKFFSSSKKFSWAELLVPEREYDTPMGMISYPAIYEATCDNFLANVERIADNREQTKKHIGVIKNSVINLQSVNRDIVVVMYGKKLFTADGEHLKITLNELTAPIRFKLTIVSNAKDVVDVMRMMNSSSKNWTFMNFITACKSVNSDYAMLHSYVTDENISVTPKMLAGIMYSTKKFRPDIANEKVKDGTFQVNITHAEIHKRLGIVKRFYSKTNMKKAQNCVWGLMRFILEKDEDYNKKEAKFLELVKNKVHERKYTTFGSDGEYYRFFNEMWNKM